MNRVCPARIVSLVAVLVPQVMLTAALAGAQTPGSTAATITGRITDATGGVLSGVTVALSGDALMGTRTATSTSDGFYRFPAVPPGEYSLVFSRQGFTRTSRDGIHVGPGFTATVDVTLSVEGVHADVTVARGSTIIDKHSTAVAANFNAQELSDLLTSRSIFAILSATPAVHVGRFEVGGTAGDASFYSAYGTQAANRPMIEGISVSGIFATGLTLNFGSFDEVSVGTAAHGPEWPLPGVQMQIIVKSGGNHYHGSAYGDYENRALQSFNIDRDQIERGAQGGPALSVRQANRVWSDHDLNADVGGYIARDKAWWYFSSREQNVAARVVNFPVRPLRTELTNYTGKVTYAFKPRNRLVLFGHAGRNHQPDRLDPFGPAGSGLTAATAINESEESTSGQLAWGWVWKGEWNGVIGDHALVELRAGGFGADRPEKPNGAGARFEDVNTLIVRGGNRDWSQNLRRNELLGSFSYVTDGPFGSHAFKAGGEIFRNMDTEIWRKSYPGDVLHVLRNGEASEVYLFETPSRSANGLWTYGAYASDSWQVNQRLTVNLGVRFDRYRVFLPEQTHPAGRFNPQPQVFAAVANVIDWNVIVPRIGMIHELSRDGRSLLKLSYGTYSFAPGAAFNANANNSPWWRRYQWSDSDTDGEWQPGEETALLDTHRGSAPDAIDPRLKLPRLNEFGTWFERELPRNIALRTGIVWRGEREHFLRQDIARPFEAFSAPVLISDPGPDGRLGTSDDGAPVHGYQLGPDASTEPLNILRNVPRSDSQFWTWDVTASRRLSHHWSLLAAFDHIWNHDQTNAYYGQSLRQNPYPLTPNDLLNAGPKGRYEFRTWSARISGTYEGPWGVRLTPYLRHQSGQPFGRTFTTRLNYGNVRILAEPIGTRRTDNVTIADVRIEKGIRLPGSRRIAGFVDVFNLFNANPEQTTSWSSGTFLRPLSIVPPRIARLGMKLDW
jgi:Carboxypeptidase regulatory-like domain/TonB dependent receptor